MSEIFLGFRGSKSLLLDFELLNNGMTMQLNIKCEKKMAFPKAMVHSYATLSRIKVVWILLTLMERKMWLQQSFGFHWNQDS